MLFAEFKVGDTLPKISLLDQFEKEHQVTTKDRLLILAFEKDVAGQIKEYLETKPKGFLDKNHAKYISDISHMPSMVTSWFAIPKMKKYPFSIMLIYDEFGKEFGRQEGKITIYRIQNYKIVSVEFISPDKLSSIF
jgi:hypothetical protein